MIAFFTLREDVNRIIDLNTHVVTDCRQVRSSCANRPQVLTLDLVATASRRREMPRDDDGVAIFVMFIRFLAFVLDHDSDFGPASHAANQNKELV